jgi:rsbT co-antagonist protein RsbR
VLAELSQSRAAQGASAGETSYFVLAIKKPLFAGLRKLLDGSPQRAFDAVWAASTLVDRMAQWTATTYQRSREDVILRQQQELLELSTPVVKLWEGVLAVPMIGTLDSSRTQLVMESLLTRIVETGSELAIIDITGVPTVDTLVAQHLLKTVTAIRLMGADCIISGIRPADRADDRPAGYRSPGHRHQGDPGRRLVAGAQEGWLDRLASRTLRAAWTESRY